MPSDINNPARNELISSEVQELISYRPHWFIRNGNAIFFCVLLLLLALTWFIDYPDEVKGPLKLFYSQPPQSRYYGQMLVSRTGLEKIRPGQRVMIQVEGYPGNEFGYLSGTVNYISNVPTDKDSFLININLPYGLNTNYSKVIFFHNNLDARAEIMTDNRRLFDRLWDGLRNTPKR
jgi:hypothetical protein